MSDNPVSVGLSILTLLRRGVGGGGKDLSIVCYVCDCKVSAAWFYLTNTGPDGYVFGKKVSFSY